MVDQHPQHHEHDQLIEVDSRSAAPMEPSLQAFLASLQKLDWWIMSSHPLTELSDLATSELLTSPRRPVGVEADKLKDHMHYSKDMQELKQYTWAYHEEWNQRRMRELKNGNVHNDVQKLNVLVQLSTIGICMRMKYEANGQEVAFDYSQTNGAPYKPERFRLAGEKDPCDDWAAMDLPPPSPPRPAAAGETAYMVKRVDCIDEGLKLQEQGLDPVVLNMADGEQPGGGYRHGAAAQEEDIFRRTDYCFSTDEDLHLQLKGLAVKSKKALYPHGRFGALYSKQVVFRQGAGHGYKLMPEAAILPFIAMAAQQREAAQRKETLSQAERQDLFRKVVLVCEVAFHKGHQSLVLGALGCGSANHPPCDVALVFRAALSCFHGCFRQVVFAIEDMESFQCFTDAFDAQSTTLMARVNTVGAPPRVSSHLTAAGGPYCLCPIAWAHICGNSGSATGWHEAECPWLTHAGGEAGEVHCGLFWHPPRCDRWAECEELENHDHKREYVHPPMCDAGEACHDFRRSHASSHAHPRAWRRSRPQLCPYQSRCPNFLDREHCSKCIHPFRAPCPSGHLCTVDPESDREHWRCYAHVCREGERCALLRAGDPEHLSAFVHPDLSLLPDGRQAGSEGQHSRAVSSTAPVERRLDFAHAGDPDFWLWRRQCSRRGCQEAGDHCRKFYHRPENIPRCPYKGINSDVDFTENHKYLSENIAAADLGLPEKDIADVEAWISRLRPTHRCRLDTFQSMLRLGAMVSTGIIDDMHQGHEAVARIAQDIAEHNPVCQRECQKHDGKGHECLELFRKYIRKVAVTTYLTNSGQYPDTSSDSAKMHLQEIETMKAGLEGLGVDAAGLLAVGKSAEQVALACHEIKVREDLGTGYSVDRHLNTHRNVFALLGPHTGQYYGHICLVLKRDVLFHADSSIIANSATALNSGNAHKNRPWCPANPEAMARDQDCAYCMDMGFECCEFKEENRKVFEKSKLHPCIHQWQRLLAQEMLGQAKHLNYEISLKGVQKMWFDNDSHAVIEAHLPSLIHLSYVEKIVMTKEQKGNLTERDWEVLRALFPSGSMLECRELPRDDRHIFKPAFDQTKDFAEAPQPELDRAGLCIALPPCHFDNRKILPLPISLRPSAAALPTQHLTLRVNKDATFCLVLAASARHLRDHRSAKEAEFVTIMLATTRSASTNSVRSSLFIGGCLPKHPDMIFSTDREREYKARGMCFVQDIDDATCETDGYRSYYVRVDASGQVLFGHYGADSFLNRKAGLYPDPCTGVNSPLKHEAHIGILTFDKTVSFVDVAVRQTPPAATTPPDALAALARAPAGLRHLHVPADDGAAPAAAPAEGTAAQGAAAQGAAAQGAAAQGAAAQGAASPCQSPRHQGARRGSSLLSWLRSTFKSPLPSLTGLPATLSMSTGYPASYLEASTTAPSASAPQSPKPQPKSAGSPGGVPSGNLIESQPPDGTQSCGTSLLPGISSDDVSLARRASGSSMPSCSFSAASEVKSSKDGTKSWQMGDVADEATPGPGTVAGPCRQTKGSMQSNSPARGGEGASHVSAGGPNLGHGDPPAPPRSLAPEVDGPPPEPIHGGLLDGARTQLLLEPALDRATSSSLPEQMPAAPDLKLMKLPTLEQAAPPEALPAAPEQAALPETVDAAPDPRLSELLIHKEALPQVLLVAPDPVNSELFIHKQMLPKEIVASPQMRGQTIKMSL